MPLRRASSLILLACLLVLPSAAQTARQQRSLEQAVEALEEGRNREAIRLLNRAKGRQASAKLPQLLALAHSKLGVELASKGDLRAALRSFQAANRAKPGELGLLLSLGHLHIRLGAVKPAERRLREVLRLSPEHPQALAYLGQIAAEEDRLGSAGDYFRRASKAAPEQKQYGELATRMQGQSEVEAEFVERRVGNFVIQYSASRELRAVLPQVEAWLKEAQRELHRSLGRAPEGPMYLVLYREEGFKKVSHAQHWANAFYDGKIRLNLDSSEALRSEMRRTLRHELAHAFLHELYGELPLWVHEGYAQMIEGKAARSAGSRFRNGEEFLRGDLFENGFASSQDMAVVAKGYAQSLMAVGSLTRGKNLPRFRSLLAGLAAGEGTEEALRKRYGLGMQGMLERARSEK